MSGHAALSHSVTQPLELVCHQIGLQVMPTAVGVTNRKDHLVMPDFRSALDATERLGHPIKVEVNLTSQEGFGMEASRSDLLSCQPHDSDRHGESHDSGSYIEAGQRPANERMPITLGRRIARRYCE